MHVCFHSPLLHQRVARESFYVWRHVLSVGLARVLAHNNFTSEPASWKTEGWAQNSNSALCPPLCCCNVVLSCQQHQMRPRLSCNSLDCALVPPLLQLHQPEWSRWIPWWLDDSGVGSVIGGCLTYPDNYVAWWKLYLLTYKRTDPDNSDTIHDFISIEHSCLTRRCNYWKFHLH